MNLRNIMLIGMWYIQKNPYCMVPYIWSSGIDKVMVVKIKKVAVKKVGIDGKGAGDSDGNV